MSKSKKSMRETFMSITDGITETKHNKKKIKVYTDGSCQKNGKVTAVGGIGIHFPRGEFEDTSKIFRLGYCTNQRTELYAIICAIAMVKKKFDLSKIKLCIYTDSEYSINCLKKWTDTWKKNNWLTSKGTPVANKELIMAAEKLVKKYDIALIHVLAHTGGDDEHSEGNAVADALATTATERAKKEIRDNGSLKMKSSMDKNDTKFKSKPISGSKTNFKKPTPALINGFPTGSNISIKCIKTKN